MVSPVGMKIPTSKPKPKRGRGRPATGLGQQVQIRMHPPMLALIDAWIARQREPLSRPEAVRRMVMQAGKPLH
jgi:hypothetical protein